MIIIGVGRASDRFFSSQNTTTQQTATADIRDFERAQGRGAGALRLARLANRSLDGHKMKSIAVRVTQHRETDASRYSYTSEVGNASGSGGGEYGCDADMETDKAKCSVKHCEDAAKVSFGIVEHPDMI